MNNTIGSTVSINGFEYPFMLLSFVDSVYYITSKKEVVLPSCAKGLCEVQSTGRISAMYHRAKKVTVFTLVLN